MHNDLITLNDT